MAMFGIIHDVAEHVPRWRLAENRSVHFVRGRSHNHEKDVIKIERRELSLFPANRACARPLLHGSVGTRCDITNHSTGEQKTVNLALGYRSCANNFFFQAEDGIRYLTVTGVQTCALPI